MPFETNVFINCPFDDEFKRLLKPLLFSLIYFNLEPKISQTESSANVRINQIKQHIRNNFMMICQKLLSVKVLRILKLKICP